jgi:uncharacterized protein
VRWIVPEFANPFPGLVPERVITTRELTRSIRMMIAAEEEATHLYEAVADATDNELARTVLQDIANEERVHVGEFQRLLNLILPDEVGWLDDGAAEVDEMAAAVAAGTPGPAAPSPPMTVGDMKDS